MLCSCRGPLLIRSVSDGVLWLHRHVEVKPQCRKKPFRYLMINCLGLRVCFRCYTQKVTTHQFKKTYRTKESDSDSSSSSSSEDSSDKAPSEEPVEIVSYILNAFTRVAHVAKYIQGSSFPDAACGARLTLEKHQYPIVDSVPADYDFCQHKACAQSHK